jgi:hypothetical protein
VRSILDRLLVPPYWTSKGVADVFFAGTLRAGGPASYHLVMLALTTPLPVLVAAVAGAVLLLRRRPRVAAFLGAWLVVSVGRHTFLGRGNYDGIRHVLDALPPLAVLAAVALGEAVATARRGVDRRAAWVLGAVLLAAPGAYAVARLHPYPVAYYNALTGGLPGAASRYETEYSGVAYREGLVWAADALGPEDRLWITRDYDARLVDLEARWLGLDVRLWRPAGSESESEPRRLLTMQILRPGPAERPAGGRPAATLPIVHEIRRDGIPLLRVREIPPADRGRSRDPGGLR